MKKNILRKAVYAGLAAVLVAGSLVIPQKTLAADISDETIMRQSDPFAFEEGEVLDVLRKEAEDLPSSYDLRHVPDGKGGEVSYVTPVKLQNPYGTCWGYAAIAAAETSLLSSGLAQEDGYDENTLDLSEKHLAFFATSYIDDPHHSQYGEGWHFRNVPKDQENTYSYRYNTGGITVMATSVFASGMGPVIERDSVSENDAYVEDVLAYRGKRGESVLRSAATAYDNDGKPVEDSYRQMPVWYSDQDDWSIPEEYRYCRSYRLKETIVLPSPAGYDGGEYVFHQEAVDAIKQQIAEYNRGVAVSFCTELYLPGQDTEEKLYMSENWAHFTNTFSYSNHTVTIIGYDDDYPRENFDSTTDNGGDAMPEGNGAFLCKNSWGSELNSFPNNGLRHWGILDGQDNVPYDPDAGANEGNRATGYFWISYYDRSLDDPEAFVFDRGIGEYDYHVEQMDLMVPDSYMAYADEGIKMANVFEAKTTSKLSGISVMTVKPGTDVSYKVYLLGEGYEDPEDGILIGTDRQHYDYGGYHLIELNDARILTRGQKYSVVISEQTENDDYICCPTVYNYDELYFYAEAVINEGESFYYSERKWRDISDDGTMNEFFGKQAQGMAVDNFPIKSYLDPITYSDGDETKVFNGYLTVNNWQEHNPGTFELRVDTTKTLAAEFRGISSDMPGAWNPVFTWEVTDSDILKITTRDPKNGSVVIEGLKPGTTELIIYAGDKNFSGDYKYPDNYGVRVLTIVVRKPEIIDMKIVDEDFEAVYTGEEIRPVIDYVVSEDYKTDLVEGVDYTVRYENNINAGTAVMTIEGIGEYGGSLVCEFVIEPADNTLNAEGKTVTVNYSDREQTIRLSDAVTFTDEGQGEKYYTKISGNEALSIDEDTGDITVGKNLAVGNYDMEISIEADGDDNHEYTEQKVMVKINITRPESGLQPGNASQTGDKTPSGSDTQTGKITPSGSASAGGTGSITPAGSSTQTGSTQPAVNKPKSDNTLEVKGRKTTVKYKEISKKKKKLSVSKVITFTDKGQGKLTFTKVKGNKKISIDENGKVTIKKGLKKGLYKVVVDVHAAGSDSSLETTKQVTIKIRVK